VLRCLLEGLEWLGEPAVRLRSTGRSAISQARARLGHEPMEELYRRVVRPIGTAASRGVWFRGWRVVSLDGSTLAVGDTLANVAAFGRPGASRGRTAFPQLRFVSLAEVGTHVLFDVAVGGFGTSEVALADTVIPRLKADMLCLADRSFYAFDRWRTTSETGCALLWRVKANQVLLHEKRLKDGSYLASVYPSPTERRERRNGVRVRVIEYTLDGAPQSEPSYRLVTNVLDAEAAPALELARTIRGAS
jgi:hypothetical protein